MRHIDEKDRSVTVPPIKFSSEYGKISPFFETPKYKFINLLKKLLKKDNVFRLRSFSKIEK